MSKVVFFDIDGTLWDWKRNIPESTVKALKELRANGHKAVICSGRAKGNIRDERLLGIGFDGIIAACGCHVEIDGDIIFQKLIDKELARLTVETILDCKMPSVLEGPQKHWVSDWGFDGDDYVANLFETMGEDAILLKEYTEDIEINKFAADVLVMTKYDELKAKLLPFYDFVEHGITPDVVRIEKGPMEITAVIEAVPKGIHKAVGVQEICEYLGVAIEDTYAIGDSANDIEMFEAVGHSVAMGNASESAKQKAEWVTTDIHEDGIYNALKHFGLI